MCRLRLKTSTVRKYKFSSCTVNQWSRDQAHLPHSSVQYITVVRAGFTMETWDDYNLHNDMLRDDWIIDELRNEKSLLFAKEAGRRQKACGVVTDLSACTLIKVTNKERCREQFSICEATDGRCSNGETWAWLGAGHGAKRGLWKGLNDASTPDLRRHWTNILHTNTFWKQARRFALLWGSSFWISGF